ncbi:MAG: type II secretion system protein N, partial [Pseudomonadota bacterium]
MKKYVLFGLAVFLCCLIALAPAGIVDRLVEQNTQMELTEVRGTLWSGHGQLALSLPNQTILPVRLSWSFQPLTLISLAPGFEWSLQNSELQLQGDAATSLSAQTVSLQGQVGATPLNRWLDLYDIVLAGEFVVHPTSLLVADTKLNDIKGQIDWSGGMVRYTLSGVLHEVDLPPLRAYLERNDQDQPTATVFTLDGSTPLIIASLTENGFARIGMTKLFTKLLRTPWPGS